jgi:transcriptional regulator with XRE-family HTH domain
MAKNDRDLTAGLVFGRRLREVRKRHGWTQQDLADRMTELGHPIHRVTLARIEKGGTPAHNVTLENVLALSFALGVSPLHMICPFDPDARLRVVSKKQAVDSILVRQWLRGWEPLLDEPRGFFLDELPPDDVERALEEMYRRRQQQPFTDAETEPLHDALERKRTEGEDSDG